ncbi:MAG: DUF5683 domain-containing protein [candidate division WOR-3 bacterium]|jgi:hypothetical protein
MFYLLLIFSKSATTAMLLTTIFPGGGQFYTERYAKGVIIGGVQSFLIYREVQTQLRLNETEEKLNNPTPELLQDKEALLNTRRELAWWMTLVWTIGILDAYVDAQLYNFESTLSLDQSGALKTELSFKIHY